MEVNIKKSSQFLVPLKATTYNGFLHILSDSFCKYEYTFFPPSYFTQVVDYYIYCSVPLKYF